MLFLAILLTTFLNTYLTTAAPTSSGTTPCHAKVFDIPWSLTGITFYTPDTTSTSQPTPQGWLRFNFIDYNDRLQLETVCLGNVTNGTVQYGDGGYVICANDNVAFKLVENGLLMASRQYRDKWYVSLGRCWPSTGDGELWC
jgi:hypothetical protein